MISHYPLKSLLRLAALFVTVAMSLATKLAAQPVITSFTPATGPVGTTVTISGSNFNTTAANNFVFFGPMRAIVNAATATTLTVKIPAGASFSQITVETNNLSAISKQYFDVTFSGASPVFTPQSFAYVANVDSVDSGIETTQYSVGDFDGDGKVDVVTIDRLNNTMAAYRNTTVGNTLSFSSKINFTTGDKPRNIAVGDINGDGKLDVVVSNFNDNTVSLFRNTSSGSNISFAAKADFATASQPGGIAIADIDGDGKPDLVVNAVVLPGFVSVLRNTGAAGTISFASKVDIPMTGESIEVVRAADMDGDGKPDIIVPNFQLNAISIFRNNSTPGNLSFAGEFDLPTGTLPDKITIGDLNGDGKADIAYGLYSSFYLTVLRNTSTTGNFTFNPDAGTYINTNTGRFSFADIGMGDLDGDGKPDLAIATGSDFVSLFKNTSSIGGIISFLLPPAQLQSPFAAPLVIADFNKDGKADLAFNSGIFRVTVWNNRTASPQISSFTPASGTKGTPVTISGANLSDISFVSFGGMPAKSFIIKDSATIIAVVDSGTTGDIVVRNSGDSANISGFTFVGPPIISSFISTSGGPDSVITISGFNFNGATSVTFGGTPVLYEVISPTTINATIEEGATGAVIVTTPYGADTLSGFTYVPYPKIGSFTPQTAATGAGITISGLNFSGVTSVTFGGTPAGSFGVVNATTIYAVVGAGSTGNLVVTSPVGTAVLSGFNYLPPPTITSFNPDTVIYAQHIGIKGHNFNNVNAVRFGGIDAYSFNVISSDSIDAILNDGTSGDVAVYTAGGIATRPGLTYIYRPQINTFAPQSSAQGGVVTITGIALATATSVSFGGVPAASFQVISDDTIKAVVGNGADGAIAVTTRAGTSTANGFSITTTPTIESVSPVSGPVGTTVTISGLNFKPGVNSDLVYFGVVKAKVLSATTLSIKAVVPAGATYGPIIVTVPSTSLSGSSEEKFDVTFPGPSGFTDSSFYQKFDLATGQTPLDVKLADVNGDGKTDFVVLNHYSHFITIYQNGSMPGSISFANRTDVGIDFTPQAIAISDLNGDGKPDIIVSADGSTGDTRIYIYRNESTPQKISFVRTSVIGGLLQTMGVLETSDVNMDGRPDIVGACTNCVGSGLYVLPNTTKNDTISFGDVMTFNPPDINEQGSVNGITPVDYDRDGKPDLLMGMYSVEAVYVMRNVTQLHSFTFFNKYPLGETYYHYNSSLKPLTAHFYSTRYSDFIANKSIYQNNAGNIVKMFDVSTSASYVFDLDGDGKQDILGNADNTGNLMLLQNTSNSSAVSFSTGLDTKVPGGGIVSADLDGDGKPEICILHQSDNILRILRNSINEAKPLAPSIISFSPDSAGTTETVTILGKNLDKVSSVSFGGVAAANFLIVSSDTIIATVGSGATGDVIVSNVTGADTAHSFKFLDNLLPEITSFNPAIAYQGDFVVINGKNFDSTTAVTFGGVTPTTFEISSSTMILAQVRAGAPGDVVVVTKFGTATKPGFIFKYPPTIDSLSSYHGNNGDKITIWGHNFENVSAVRFGGYDVSWTVVDSTTVIASLGAVADGAVTVFTVAGNGSIYGFTYGIATGINPIEADEKLLKIYPNPAREHVVVQFPISNLVSTIRLIDVNGRIVDQIFVGPGNARTNVSTQRLVSGAYRLVWSDGKKSLAKTVLIIK